MEPIGVLYFFLRFFLLLIMSHLVDLLLARSMSRGGYFTFRWFGVAVHEMSHAIAAWLTGTRVTEINLFDQGGGYVRHEKRGPGVTVVISMAPAIGGPVVVVLLAILFGYLGVYYPTGAPGVGSLQGMMTTLPGALYSLFYINITSWDPLIIALFALLLVLVCSVASTLAPSSTDLKNGALGLVLVGLCLALTAHYKPLDRVPGITDRFGTPTPGLDFGIAWLGAGLNVGLFACVVLLLIAGPLYLIKGR